MKNGYTDVLQNALPTGDTAMTGVSSWKLHPPGNQNLLSADDFYIFKRMWWNNLFIKEETSIFLFRLSREMYNISESRTFCATTSLILWKRKKKLNICLN